MVGDSMILINKEDFDEIFNNKELNLPLKWDGGDFKEFLNKHYELYLDLITPLIHKKYLEEIKSNCHDILKTIDYYFQGNPAQAFDYFKDNVMEYLKNDPIDIFQKNGYQDMLRNDPLNLYRVRNVSQEKRYLREDLFHTPYNLRNKVASCRYSIAGYPCLYLGTSLSLCCEETKKKDDNLTKVAARFKLKRLPDDGNNRMIYVYDLALKPEDFFIERRDLDGRLIYYGNHKKCRYTMWYPILAASSVIQSNSNDSFVAEYIIPQLLMQWLKSESDENTLYGIRYFSCTSEKASRDGYNYVFPVSGKKHNNREFCPHLSKSFRLTVPTFINEYDSINEWEEAMKADSDLQFI